MFGRILKGLGVALVAVVLALVLSVPLDAALGRGRVAAVAPETLPGVSGPAVAAFVARPAGVGHFPAVVMVHEFWGLTPDLVGKADLLAQEGYVVVAPDTFRGSATRWLPRAIYQTFTTPREQIDADLDAAFAWLAAQPDVDPTRIAVMGFCYGGRAALHYSLHNPEVAATAVFYGTPVTDPEALRTLPGPVLGIFGTEDRQIPVADVAAFRQALTAAGVPHQVSLYEGEGHAFVTSVADIREDPVQARAWEELVSFLARALQSDGD